jgi:LuxR family maltose regulon positive regulatory protein
MPNVRPVEATRARLLVATGRLVEARAWAAQGQLSASDDLSYLREYEHVTLAMLLLAEEQQVHSAQRSSELLRLLARLHDATEVGGRVGTLIEVLVLQSLALAAAGNDEEAVSALGRAVSLGEPERYVRVFADRGPRLLPGLRGLASEHPGAAYVRVLMAACAPADEEVAQDVATTARPALVDPLSQRELEVLRLLATDLSGPELARQLVVSLNTLRTHTRNVYTKLGVSGRRAAVSRARELDLLGRP